MKVSLTELRANVGKYLGLSNTEDIIITRYRKPCARIKHYTLDPWNLKHIPEEIVSIENLFGTLPNDINLDDVKLKRLMR